MLTGFPNHPTGKVPREYRAKLWKLFMRDDRDGVQVRRTFLLPLPNRKSWERMLNYASFAISASLRGLFLAKPEIVIATSPQLLVGLAGLVVAKMKRVPFVFEVRDLWPESLEAVGVSGRTSVLVRGLRKVAGLLYREADHIVVVTPSFKTHLEREWSVPPEKISVVMNGVDEKLFRPEVEHGQLIDKLELQDRFVVSYIGTIGNAHGTETLVHAAEIMAHTHPRALFVLIGEGAEKEQIRSLIAEKQLSNIRVFSAEPRERIPAVLAASDVCVVLLRKADLFRTTIPTKMMEMMSCARPIILGVEGEAAALLDRAGAGICIPPEDARKLAEAVQLLWSNPPLRIRLGQSGRQFIVSELTRDATACQYETILQRVIAPTTARPTLRKSAAGV